MYALVKSSKCKVGDVVEIYESCSTETKSINLITVDENTQGLGKIVSIVKKIGNKPFLRGGPDISWTLCEVEC